jgi:glucose/arabinose dehydrogenase
LGSFIAPLRNDLVTGDKYPHGRGSLKFQYLELVKLDGDKIIGRQKIATDIGRVRNVAQGPDGFVYLGVEGKEFLKLYLIKLPREKKSKWH